MKRTLTPREIEVITKIKSTTTAILILQDDINQQIHYRDPSFDLMQAESVYNAEIKTLRALCEEINLSFISVHGVKFLSKQ